MPATSEYVTMICDSAANVQTIADILAIFTVRVYAGCSWASSSVFLPRLGILVHRGKRMAPNVRAPNVTDQAMLWRALVAGSAQRVKAPGSGSCWTPGTPDWLPMTIRHPSAVSTGVA